MEAYAGRVNQRGRNKSRRNALRTLRRRDTVGLMLIGKCEVGKSALLHRWLRGQFMDQYKPTVEDFHVKAYKHVGQCVNVGIIDMTGSWDFPAMMELYLARVDSVMFVYDIGSDESVKDLELLYERLTKVRGEQNDVLISVVGTKIDKNQDHYNDYRNEEVDKFLKSIDIPEERHTLTSARLNLNINEAFENALNEVIENMVPNEDAIRRLGKLMEKNGKTGNWFKKLCCCRI